MARLPYVDDDDLPPERRSLLDSSTPSGELSPEFRGLLADDRRNVYRALAHCPEALERFRAFAGAVAAEDGLPPRLRELAILAAARALDSRYVWHQHVRIALNEGASRGELLAVSGRRYDGFPADEAAVLRYVDAFVRDEVDDERHDDLAGRLGPAGVVRAGLLAGVYVLVARFLSAAAVETEEPFVGWELDGLP